MKTELCSKNKMLCVVTMTSANERYILLSQVLFESDVTQKQVKPERN